jgi:hypothetical protein
MLIGCGADACLVVSIRKNVLLHPSHGQAWAFPRLFTQIDITRKAEAAIPVLVAKSAKDRAASTVQTADKYRDYDMIPWSESILRSLSPTSE